MIFGRTDDRTSRRRFVPLVLALGMFTIGTASLCILGVGPALTEALKVDPSAAGWLVTAFSATFAISAPLSQFAFGKRYSTRSLIIAGALILAAAMVWATATPDFTGLLLSRVLAAFGGALIAPASAALAVAAAPDGRRGVYLATIFAGFTVSTVLGVPLATWLALEVGWRGVMAMIAASVLIFLFFILFLVPRTNQAQLNLKVTQGVFSWGTAVVLLTSLGMLAGQFAVYSLMGEFLQQKFGVGDDFLPLAILLFGIMGVAGNAAAGLLTDRLGAEIIVWASFVGMTVTLLTLNADLGPMGGALALAGCAFAGTLFSAPQQGRLVDTVRQDQHALAFALNSSAGYSGIAVGSGIASMLAVHYGLSALPIVAVAVILLTALVNALGMVRWRSRRGGQS